MEGYLFVSPWVIGFLLFMAIPLGQSLYYSLNELKLSREGLIATYIGWRHYSDAFTTDIAFLPLLKQTITSMLVQVPLIMIFSLISALLLHRPSRGRMIFRGIFFMPVIIASGVILKKLLDQGVAKLPLFTESLYDQLNLFIPDSILVPVFLFSDKLTPVMWDSGVQILIFLAGLLTISASLYEAARCDGATRWECFWKITFPMIMPMIFVNTLFSIVNSFTKADNQVMGYIQTVVNSQNKYDYAAALGWIYFIIIFIVLTFVFLIFRKSMTAVEGRA